MAKDTLSYYERNADAFIKGTQEVDMASLYDQFLPLLPNQSHILDAGCGSGRDSAAFQAQGFEVTACDASPTLASRVTERYGIPVEIVSFQDFEWCHRFDGIWACASLLHVQASELPQVFGRLTRALKPGGVMYFSFKYGQCERFESGRHFTDLDEEALESLLATTPELSLERCWVTQDQRPDRQSEKWINALARKRG